jgi:CoA:oxalate CoA-transferase
MPNADENDAPLAGIRVLDFSMFMAGPYCTRLMADMGAEVIKIEPPSGDFLRAAPPVRDGHSAYFGVINCGKRSIALDLKQPAAQHIVHELARTADVVIENFRPGVMARLNLDYSTLRQDNPRLIYCSVSGYGQTGPRAGRASFAPIIQAASGFDTLIPTYDNEIERPVAHRYVIADVLAATHALAGINAALFKRTQTGRGDRLDIAMMDTMLSMLSYEYAAAQFPDAQGPMVFKPMRTRDGFIAIAPVSEANFVSLAEAAGHLEWLEDSRFSSRAARVDNWAALLVTIEAWTATTTSAGAEQLLIQHGCPASAYRTVAEASDDAQVAARSSRVMVSDAAGEYAAPHCAIQFAEANTAVNTRVPSLGEDAPALLSELGYSDEKIATLRAQGLFG